MLWLSLVLPRLALEVYTRGEPEVFEHTPFAVYETHGSRRWVHDCNARAQAQGVSVGMAISAALALCAELQIRPRDHAGEAQALGNLALWSTRFTSSVSLQAPDALLLDVGGSLRLFGGLAPLQEEFLRGLDTLGHAYVRGIAPTPLAAWLCACAGHAAPILTRAQLAPALRPLPLARLPLPPQRLSALHGLGLKSIGDCLRLPRAGLARRLGADTVALLDRMLGTRPDPRPRFEPPARFEARLPLPVEIANCEALLFPLRRLLLTLEGFLLGRGAAAQHLALCLWHQGGGSTALDIGLVAPSRDPAHLLTLTREHLERLTLAAPVEALTLRVEHLVPLDAEHRDLFTAPKVAHQDWQALVERLRARLGDAAVTGLAPQADHRPERAWRHVPPGQAVPLAPAPTAPPRPLCLLEPPRPLQAYHGKPLLDGAPLTLLQGPERIETAWWEERGALRDYFIAQSADGARVWLYRERCPEAQWFMHGVWG